jgi:hypothetical protein
MGDILLLSDEIKSYSPYQGSIIRKCMPTFDGSSRTLGVLWDFPSIFSCSHVSP